MRVGLVLGGGGVVGLAYHAAALAALENDLCWDPSEAEVIVGTSAGSLAAALLRFGATPLELAAVAVGSDVETLPAPVLEVLRADTELPPFSPAALLRRTSAPNLGIVLEWLKHPWRVDPLRAVVSVLGEGELDLSDYVKTFGDAIGTSWPRDELWVCAVRQRDLRRRVFGRDVHASLPDAVSASCSIPGYFRPVVIEGESYVDGGVCSPTNADVLRRRPLDLVIIVSPMSGRSLGFSGSDDLMRRYAQRKLEREVETLHGAGIPSVVIEPSREVRRMQGTDFMSRDHLAEVTHAAFMDAGEQLQAPFVRTLLGGLDGRRARRVAPTANEAREATSSAAGLLV